jgi:5-methylcytosine-specific restriction endonuclease McrA
MEFLLRNLLEQFPNLSRKDNQRGFTHVQKLAIFRRDKGICQVARKCDGVKITWDDWHADHHVPWSKGGKTTVENGQVSCSACNLSKGAG